MVSTVSDSGKSSCRVLWPALTDTETKTANSNVEQKTAKVIPFRVSAKATQGWQRQIAA